MPFQGLLRTADLRAQLSEFRVIKRSSSDLEGTQRGSRRKRDT